MESFFTGANLVWIIGIISSIIAGLSALSKFRYENKLQLFKDTNVNIFKKEKEEVLAAISTLSVFKRDPRFERHTTNVLLSRLYTELDYDITNAICSALIQYSNRQELLDISSEVLDINRNFFVQTSPVSQMVSDLDRSWDDLKAAEAMPARIAGSKGQEDQNADVNENTGADLAKEQKETVKEPPGDLEKASSKELLEIYRQRSLIWIPKKRYELLWHKQITADTYSRILRRAYYSKPEGWNRMRHKFYKFIKAKRKSNRFKELDMNFYQNDFNYVYMADFKTSSCNIVRSAIGSAVIVDVGFLNIGSISGTSFSNTNLHDCQFRGGEAKSNTSFESCKFFKGRFENIYLEQVNFNTVTCEGVVFDGEPVKHPAILKMNQCSFTSSSFSNCTFRNCILDSSAFLTCLFENVLFENVQFTDSYFCNSNLIQVKFVNCIGLQPRHFYKYYGIDGTTQFPSQFTKADIDGLEKVSTENIILSCNFNYGDRTHLQSIFNQP